MKPAKWLPTALSFLFGASVGAVAVWALVISIGVPRTDAGAAGNQPSSHSATHAGADDIRPSAQGYDSLDVVSATPVGVKKGKRDGTRAHVRPPQHSECDLQLD